MRQVNTPRAGTRVLWLAAALSIALPCAARAQAAPPGGAQGQRGAGPGVPGAPGGPQGRGGPAGRGGGSARTAAPVDLTGYWVSIVTEDWIERMSPDSPPSGAVDAGQGGFGRGGRGRGGAPAGPTTSDKCRVYAAGGSLRVPGRLHITWADDNTLKVEMDAGTQTRLFHFDGAAPEGAAKTLQGYSAASWEGAGGGRGGAGGFPGAGGRGGGRGAAAPRWGVLKVETTNLAGGYLLSSRNTYSENATLTEYFTRHSDFGVDYFTVTAVIDEGGQQRITSSTFKKEADGSKFAPTGCEIVK